MKKLAMAFAAAMLLSGCIGFVQGRSADGRVTHDMYVFHPIISISANTSHL